MQIKAWLVGKNEYKRRGNRRNKMDLLRRLQRHALHKDIRLVRRPRVHFVRAGKRVKGLTKLLHAVCPVPQHESATCPRCSRRNDHALRRVTGTCQPGPRSRKTKAALIPISATPVGVAAQRVCQGRTDTEHGRIVDRQIGELARGKALENPDPCVLTFVTVLRDRKWRLLSSQVNLWCPDVGRATAADALVTSTGRDLILLEIKATRRAGPNGEATDACYRAATGTRAGIPLSRYTQHQLQLYCMDAAIRAADIPLSAAYVVRLSTVGADVYPLNSWLRDRAPALLK